MVATLTNPAVPCKAIADMHVINHVLSFIIHFAGFIVRIHAAHHDLFFALSSINTEASKFQRVMRQVQNYLKSISHTKTHTHTHAHTTFLQHGKYIEKVIMPWAQIIADCSRSLFKRIVCANTGGIDINIHISLMYPPTKRERSNTLQHSLRAQSNCVHRLYRFKFLFLVVWNLRTGIIDMKVMISGLKL